MLAVLPVLLGKMLEKIDKPFLSAFLMILFNGLQQFLRCKALEPSHEFRQVCVFPSRDHVKMIVISCPAQAGIT